MKQLGVHLSVCLSHHRTPLLSAERAEISIDSGGPTSAHAAAAPQLGAQQQMRAVSRC